MPAYLTSKLTGLLQAAYAHCAAAQPAVKTLAACTATVTAAWHAASPQHLQAADPCCIPGAASIEAWAETLAFHMPPVQATLGQDPILNLAEQLSVIVFAIVVPLMLTAIFNFMLVSATLLGLSVCCASAL